MKRIFDEDGESKRSRTEDPKAIYDEYKKANPRLIASVHHVRDHSITHFEFLLTHSLLSRIKNCFQDPQEITLSYLAKCLVEARISKPFGFSWHPTHQLELTFCLPGCQTSLVTPIALRRLFRPIFNHRDSDTMILILVTPISAISTLPTHPLFTTYSQQRFRLGLQAPLPIECNSERPCHHEKKFRLLSYFNNDLGIPVGLVGLFAPQHFAHMDLVRSTRDLNY